MEYVSSPRNKIPLMITFIEIWQPEIRDVEESLLWSTVQLGEQTVLWSKNNTLNETLASRNMPLICYVSLGKLFNLSVPQFPHL